jgi:hypothetical protein
MRAVLFLLFASSLFGADLSGIWVGQLERPNRDPLDLSFQFTQTGSTLKGKLYGDYGSEQIVEGTVEGDKIRFVVFAQEQAGNQINEVKLTFEGEFKDGVLEMTRDRGPSRNAANAGDSGLKRTTNTPKLSFKLKRLL